MKRIKELFNRIKSPPAMETFLFPVGEAINFGHWWEFGSYKAVKTWYGGWKVIVCHYLPENLEKSSMAQTMISQGLKPEPGIHNIHLDKDYGSFRVFNLTTSAEIYATRDAAIRALEEWERRHTVFEKNSKILAFFDFQQKNPQAQHVSRFKTGSGKDTLCSLPLSQHIKKSP